MLIYNNPDIYIYGMTVMSNIYLLAGPYPKADTYQEIHAGHHVPGGETGNSAIVLANLGHKVKIDGPYLGRDSKVGIESFCQRYAIDCSNMTYDEDFIGVKDVVLIGPDTRTVFGWFGQYFSDPIRRWTEPDYKAINHARVVGIDPYFPDSSDETARYCTETKKPYVAIDSTYDSVIHKGSSVMIISNEYINNTYPGMDHKELMQAYTDRSDGLVIFTFGSKDILYSRKSMPINTFHTYKVDVVSTLGAGDTFRAGALHGLFENYDDLGIVRFAAATAACVISRFPMALIPPTLEEIQNLINNSTN
jgi:sugar/nucleoside kinase (ribokinase family)